MTPELSEFSYGFSLTHEIVNVAGAAITAAPIFPSLIEEGKAGGGYDVRLDLSGVLLFLQFKRADCLVRRSAKQIQEGLPLTVPYYRFSLMESSRSAQHSLLLALDVDPNNVFYVAPRFHLVSELNDAYNTRTVSRRSFYIRPRDIGSLTGDRHSVAFDQNKAFVCSEPRHVEAMNGQALTSLVDEQLRSDERTLTVILDKALASMEGVLTQLNIRPTDFDIGHREKTPEEAKIRRIADLALRYFNTQFVICQRKESAPP